MKRLSTEQDKQNLIDLYNLCFSGEDDFCRTFFDNVWSPLNTAVIEHNGKIISMAQMLPVALRDGKEKFSAYYIYALCTHPDYRGQKKAQELLEFCEKENSECDFCILIAGNEKLVEYYKKLGFKAVFGFRKYSVSPQSENILYRKTDDYSAVNKIFENSAFGKLHNLRTNSDLKANLLCYGAEIYLGENSYIIAADDKEKLSVIEAIGENAETIAKDLCFKKGLKSAEITTFGEGEMLGMLKPISKDFDGIGYLNLLFN